MHARTLLGTVAGLGLAAAVAAEQTFRAGVDLVTFGVTVTDRSGRPSSPTSRRDDFEVVEDGKPQTVVHFATGVGEAAGADRCRRTWA